MLTERGRETLGEWKWEEEEEEEEKVVVRENSR